MRIVVSKKCYHRYTEEQQGPKGLGAAKEWVMGLEN